MGRRQPAQRPTIAHVRAFLNYRKNHRTLGRLRRWLASFSSLTNMLRNRLTPTRASVKRRGACPQMFWNSGSRVGAVAKPRRPRIRQADRARRRCPQPPSPAARDEIPAARSAGEHVIYPPCGDDWHRDGVAPGRTRRPSSTGRRSACGIDMAAAEDPHADELPRPLLHQHGGPAPSALAAEASVMSPSRSTASRRMMPSKFGSLPMYPPAAVTRLPPGKSPGGGRAGVQRGAVPGEQVGDAAPGRLAVDSI